MFNNNIFNELKRVINFFLVNLFYIWLSIRLKFNMAIKLKLPLNRRFNDLKKAEFVCKHENI